jgi:hypothetical protein
MKYCLASKFKNGIDTLTLYRGAYGTLEQDCFALVDDNGCTISKGELYTWTKQLGSVRLI